MMHRIKMLTFYLVLLTSLIGCSSTGGTIGGLIPAPKFTKGDLSDGIYTAQDKSFIVNSPFDKDSYEYTYMAIAERYSDKENSIQFSSSAAPAEVYRINVFKNVSPEEQLEKVAFESYKKQMESAYNTPFKNRAVKTMASSGIQAMLVTYSQHIPERSSLGVTAEALDVLHTCTYIEKNNNSAFICINRMAPNADNYSEGAEDRLKGFV
jgi:major membrane immunogen (membrane-anchored lipoprotein)